MREKYHTLSCYILLTATFASVFCDYQSVKGQGRTTAMWMAIGLKTRKKSEFKNKKVTLKDQIENPGECSSLTENRGKSCMLQNYNEGTMDQSMEPFHDRNREWDSRDEEDSLNEMEEEEVVEEEMRRGKEGNVKKFTDMDGIEPVRRFENEIGGGREKKRAAESLSGQREKEEDNLNVYQSSVHTLISGQLSYFV